MGSQRNLWNIGCFLMYNAFVAILETFEYYDPKNEGHSFFSSGPVNRSVHKDKRTLSLNSLYIVYFIFFPFCVMIIDDWLDLVTPQWVMVYSLQIHRRIPGQQHGAQSSGEKANAWWHSRCLKGVILDMRKKVRIEGNIYHETPLNQIPFFIY